MTKFTDSMTKPDESLAIVNDYFRKPNENWFFSVSEKAVKFLLEEIAVRVSSCRPLAKR